MPPTIRTLEDLINRLQTIQRHDVYTTSDYEGEGSYIDQEPSPYGEWIRYSEIEDILNDLDED